MQTYAGATLGQHVTQPFVDAFNKAANGEMVIELFFADQIVPTGELFRAMQAARSTRCIPTTIRWLRRWKCGLFGGYFPFATRSILDVPVLFQQYGLGDIWREAYSGRSACLALGRRPGSVQLQHQEGNHQRRRSRRPEALHLPDRRPLPDPVRRRAGFNSLRGRRSRGPDRRTRRHVLVRASPRTTRSAGPM
jgi:hypothetical protein